MADFPSLRRMRALLLGLVAFGAVGLAAELILLEHWGDPRQWIPLTLLVASLGGVAAVVVRPGPTSLRLFRGVMVLVTASGVAGTLFHVQANAGLEREIDPTISGAALAWAALGGGTPSLAPGAMIQLGLLGLLAVLRHPAESE
jgi:hypothetical protein